MALPIFKEMDTSFTLKIYLCVDTLIIEHTVTEDNCIFQNRGKDSLCDKGHWELFWKNNLTDEFSFNRYVLRTHNMPEL